jgi:cob(I)alamin adenosyltransferase
MKKISFKSFIQRNYSIYTKKGDDGKSSHPFRNERIYKNNIFFECLGSIDLLSSHIGLTIEFLNENKYCNFLVCIKFTNS